MAAENLKQQIADKKLINPNVITTTIGMNSSTLKKICGKLTFNHNRLKKQTLHWRESHTSQHALGWFQFNANSLQIQDDEQVTTLGHHFRLWLSRPFQGRVLCDSFSQSTQGHGLKKYHPLLIRHESEQPLQTKIKISLTDPSSGVVRDLLKYKAIRRLEDCIEVSESFSAVTCSTCHPKTGPSGLSDPGVREWTCSARHAPHDCDISAARNILRFGRESLRAMKIA